RRTGRKIIVATNIAETSLTIPGVKYVLDSGLARISQYNPRTRTTALPIVPVSKSSADQRMGRCGRVENGICIRLFPESDYESRPRFTQPEILRANLAEVILRMLALNLPPIADFPFVDRPPEKSIRDGFDLLVELGAIRQVVQKPGKKSEPHPFVLTNKGNRMAAIPLDPRLSRMLIEARQEGCLKELVVITSALSTQDPRERPTEKAAQADAAHAQFNSEASDFLTLLNIWIAFHRQVKGPGLTGKMKKFCTAHFISFRRMREWRDIYSQIIGVLKTCRWDVGKKPWDVLDMEIPAVDTRGRLAPMYEKIHKSILSGFLSNIAVHKEGKMYQAGKGRQAMIFPGSGMFKKPKPWIVAAEIMETSRLFARTAAHIDPDWIEPLAESRCKYTYLDPHWEKNRGQVVATQQVSLYGLIIASGRKVAYGRIDPEAATDIFIKSALIDGDIKRPMGFIQHNRQLVSDIEEMENRVRRRDLLISEADLAAFYKKHLSGVFDIRSLVARIRQSGGDGWLRMRRKDLLRYQPVETEMAQYPDTIHVANQKLACEYHFEPDTDRDGVTVRIPATCAGQISRESLGWLVPGLCKEKITLLLRGLPKAYRRRLTPISDTVSCIMAEMPQGKHAIGVALSEFIWKRFQIRIPPSAWSEVALPDHLKMRFSIRDPKGKEIYAGRDTRMLVQNGATDPQADEFNTLKKAWEKMGIREWNFGDLPDTVTLSGSGKTVWTAVPALAPAAKGDGVDLRLFLNTSKASVSHRKGVQQLYCLLFKKDLKFMKKALALPGSFEVMTAGFGGRQAMEQQLYDSLVKDLFAKPFRTKKEFFAYAESIALDLMKTAREKLESVLPVLAAVHETRSILLTLARTYPGNGQMRAFVTTVRSELGKLVPDAFITLYDASRLGHLVRYAEAL
ncbi:MAG: ATP-dependent RNA helicase HrpA, partial [Deltaproteobacteria bacterium]|nr:ATP-dependent RNA helicase HrpA [Deltaproteobacteria bacterium]